MTVPEDSVLWKVAPELAARLHPADLVAIEPGPDEDLTPTPEALVLLRRLGCPTVARRVANDVDILAEGRT